MVVVVIVTMEMDLGLVVEVLNMKMMAGSTSVLVFRYVKFEIEFTKCYHHNTCM